MLFAFLIVMSHFISLSGLQLLKGSHLEEQKHLNLSLLRGDMSTFFYSGTGNTSLYVKLRYLQVRERLRDKIWSCTLFYVQTCLCVLIHFCLTIF